MAFSSSSRGNKMTVVFGSFSKWFALTIYAILFLYLLGKIKSEDPTLYQAMEWGIMLALIGVVIGGVLTGMSFVETATGREDFIQGIQFSVIFLAIGFVFNWIFVFSRHAYSLVGDAAVLNKGERFLASLAAALNEELFFRFAVQRMVQALVPDNPVGWSISVGVSATMFATFHVYVYGARGIMPFVYLFILGAMAGLGLATTKRFSVPLLIHVENNVLALLWGG